ncbi:MAG: diacylglycerol kinase family protein [bacterium]
MKARLIANPSAGQGRANRLLSPVIERLKKMGYDVDIALTSKEGDGIKLARDAVEKGFELIVAGGGDGTLNEVINGMVGSPAILGVIPLGTVNVFCQEVGIGLDSLSACDCLKEGEIKRIDLGLAGNRYFILCAGIGFDAHVVSELEKEFKRIMGALAYPISGLKSLFSWKPTRMLISIDDQPLKRKGFLVVIGNIKAYAGPEISVTPLASLDDGWLDLCIFKKRTALDILRYTLGVITRSHTEFEDIEYFKAKYVKIEAEEPVLVHTDCEVIGTVPMEFSIAPAILPVILPSEKKQ